MRHDQDFYQSPRWRRLRTLILRRDKYQCVESRRYGKIVEAETVHHVFPREQFPEYQWEAWNLISLSKAEHNRLHDRDTHELTDAGLALMKRIARREGIEISDHGSDD